MVFLLLEKKKAGQKGALSVASSIILLLLFYIIFIYIYIIYIYYYFILSSNYHKPLNLQFIIDFLHLRHSNGVSNSSKLSQSSIDSTYHHQFPIPCKHLWPSPLAFLGVERHSIKFQKSLSGSCTCSITTGYHYAYLHD